MQLAVSESKGRLSQFLPMLDQQRSFAARTGEESRPSTYRVLIFERSAPLAKLLATGLSAESLVVDVTHEPEELAARLDSRSYNLVILDMDAPNVEGISLLQGLRARKPDTRVLGLSGRSTIEDLVAALDHGADDYLFKPFSLLELMARVRALRRRSEAMPPRRPEASKLVLHPDRCRVERDGRSIDLTPREFALLEVMLKNAGKTLSRAMLTQEVWNMSAEASTNIVDVYIKYLRDKLDGEHDEKLIRTVRGMGYVLQIA
jgi:two-component system copper resistance phosphate regulon response regulator CusR